MRCPTCGEEGATSRVYGGAVTTTCMSAMSYWDEEGRAHVHDPNIRAQRFTCSRGHEFAEYWRQGCVPCGEPLRKDVSLAVGAKTA